MRREVCEWFESYHHSSSFVARRVTAGHREFASIQLEVARALKKPQKAEKRRAISDKDASIEGAAQVHFQQLQTIVINAQKRYTRTSNAALLSRALRSGCEAQVLKALRLGHGSVPIPTMIQQAEATHLFYGACIVDAMKDHLLSTPTVSNRVYLDSCLYAEGFLRQATWSIPKLSQDMQFSIEGRLKEVICQREIVCDWYDQLPSVSDLEYCVRITAGSRYFVSILRRVLKLVEECRS